jgi:glyoxylate utilization-related uncharacterized protein
MKARDIRDMVHFSDEGPVHRTLFDTDHLWSEILCLDGSQGVGPIGDATSDALVAVLAGEIAAQIDKGRTRMGQWDSILVPAGAQLTMRNASEEPAVVLVVVAPPPAAG